MNSRLPKLSAALTISILVNYFIAWAAFVPVEWAKMGGTFASTTKWPASTPTDWPNPRDVMTKSAWGLRIQEWHNVVDRVNSKDLRLQPRRPFP